jgi:uncharacterized OB-fold protein
MEDCLSYRYCQAFYTIFPGKSSQLEYPRSECPRCLSNHLEWVRVSGRGRLHTYTIVYQPANAAFRDDTPYIYAVVQLDEGPRLVSNVVQCDLDAVKVDMPLEAIFDDVTPECTLVKFKPASR